MKGKQHKDKIGTSTPLSVNGAQCLDIGTSAPSFDKFRKMVSPSTTLRMVRRRMVSLSNHMAEPSLSANSAQCQRIGIISLGCPRNLVDSESILGRFALKGYSIADINEADVGIVNTCAFIEDAKTESIDAILDLVDLKRRGKLKKIIVYGCLVQRYKDELKKELPEIDAFVGRSSLNDGIARHAITPRHYAYLKICEGCINNCSYCAIPQIKGRFTSLDMDSLLSKAEALDNDGVFELNIIGQDITGYGIDLYGTQKLVRLLEGIIKKCRNIGWIRLLYLHPERISDELLELIKNQPKVCKYVDMPIQHINGRILRLMNRQTTKKDILRLIEKVRKKIPGVAIRTSLIVGFPSETNREFEELLGFVSQIRFERLGVFIYSREEGTPAHNFKSQIPRETKIERFNAVMLEQQAISRKINERFLGKTLDVLIDDEEGGSYLGRSQYDAPEVDGLVYVCPVRENKAGNIRLSSGLNSRKELKPGDFIRVKINDTLEYDLAGEPSE